VLSRLKRLVEAVLDKAFGGRLPLDPNAITLLSLVLSATVVAAALLGLPPLSAALLLLLSALLDALDGYVARRTGKVTSFGAFLDSTVDRASDALHTYALLLYGVLGFQAAYALLASELLVSYTRARAESLGVNLSGVGLMERGERVLAKAAALASRTVDPTAARAIAYALLALTAATVLQRVVAVARRLRAEARLKAAGVGSTRER